MDQVHSQGIPCSFPRHFKISLFFSGWWNFEKGIKTRRERKRIATEHWETGTKSVGVSPGSSVNLFQQRRTSCDVSPWPQAICLLLLNHCRHLVFVLLTRWHLFCAALLLLMSSLFSERNFFVQLCPRKGTYVLLQRTKTSPCLVPPVRRRPDHCSNTVATVSFCFYLVTIVQLLTN